MSARTGDRRINDPLNTVGASGDRNLHARVPATSIRNGREWRVGGPALLLIGVPIVYTMSTTLAVVLLAGAIILAITAATNCCDDDYDRPPSYNASTTYSSGGYYSSPTYATSYSYGYPAHTTTVLPLVVESSGYPSTGYGGSGIRLPTATNLFSTANGGARIAAGSGVLTPSAPPPQYYPTTHGQPDGIRIAAGSGANTSSFTAASTSNSNTHSGGGLFSSSNNGSFSNHTPSVSSSTFGGDRINAGNRK